MKNGMATLAAIAAATTLMAAAMPARATVVYNTTANPTDAIDQQTGNNFYSIGEEVTIAPAPAKLNTVSVVFGSSSAGSAFTYTPDITLSLYDNATDANGQGATGLLGSAVVHNVTFTNDGVVDPAFGYNYEDEQELTFDFTSQNIVLPSTFVIAYHDAASLDSNGSVDGANGLSVGLTDTSATVGTSHEDTFTTYPNGSPSVLNTTWDAGFNIEASIDATAVPLPASAWSGLALLGGLGLYGTVKRHLKMA